MADIEKLLNSENIVCHVVLLDSGVNGYVYRSRKGKYHIFISDSLSSKGKLEVLFHEIHHIKMDMPERPYTIGLDMQREYFEGQADIFAREMASAYVVKYF